MTPFWPCFQAEHEDDTARAAATTERRLAAQAAEFVQRVEALSEERDAIQRALAEAESVLEAKHAAALAAAAAAQEQARAAEQVHAYQPSNKP